jgi:hypothetical protein
LSSAIGDRPAVSLGTALALLICLTIMSASPSPFCDICWAICWSYIEVYSRVWSLLNTPSCGKAERMLFSIICTNMPSTCCATCLRLPCGSAAASRFRPFSAWAS